MISKINNTIVIAKEATMYNSGAAAIHNPIFAHIGNFLNALTIEKNRFIISICTKLLLSLIFWKNKLLKFA
jgi:hypothetical protein